jgi:Flp pilus assembly protein TadG
MLSNHQKNKGNRRSGAAALEFAMVASVLFMIIFQMIAFGRAYLCVHVLNETSRRACNVAVTLNSSKIAATGNATYTGNWNQYVIDTVITPSLVANAIPQATTKFILVNDATADISTANSASLTTTTTGSGNSTVSTTYYQPGDEITIQITVPVNTVTWGGSIYLMGKTLQGQYTLRKE